MPHCNDSDVDIVDIPEWRALLDWEESGCGMFTTHCWKTELLSLPLLTQTLYWLKPPWHAMVLVISTTKCEARLKI